MRKFIQTSAVVVLSALLAASAAYATQQNVKDLGVFLTGRLVAEGKFSDYIGGSTRGLRVDIQGVSRGETIDLVEDMVYSDGETRKYVWKFTKENDEYVGHRADLIGKAKVTRRGDAVEIAYRANILLPGGKEQELDFVETLIFEDASTAKMKIQISKLFLPVANAQLTVKKLSSAEKGASPAPQRSADSSR